MRPAVSSRRRAPGGRLPARQSQRVLPSSTAGLARRPRSTRSSHTDFQTPAGLLRTRCAFRRSPLRTRKNSMADDMSMSPSRDDFAALLDESFGGRDFMEGSVVKGMVVGIEKDFAIIDVGLKTEGRIQVRNSASMTPAS